MLLRLEAAGFRNLAPLLWEPVAGSNLLLGGNGAGKTSLLEAIYAVATTRSFRTPRLVQCIQHDGRHHRSGTPEPALDPPSVPPSAPSSSPPSADPDPAALDGFTLRAEVEREARVSLLFSWSRSDRRRSVNGEQTSLAEHLEVLPVVAWTGAEIETLSGPPALRRRFLDRGVVSLRPRALEALKRYREALGHKRQLLGGAPGGSGSQPAPRADLEAWNQVLAGAAAEVIALRAAYLARLETALEETLAAIELPLPPIRLVYRPSPRAGLEGAEALRGRLEELADRERRAGSPLAGPHRDDLAILWGGHPVGEVASAGERKLLSLALTLAQGRVLEAAGRSPVYLLDDLDAELAPESLAAVWKAFAEPAPQGGSVGPGRQLFASSNRPAVWQELPVERRWPVRAGRLAAVEA